MTRGSIPGGATSGGGDVPLRIAVIGMDARQQTVLEMVLDRHCRDTCRLTANEEAEACLLDMDSVRAGERLVELRRRYPGRPTLLLSVQPLTANVRDGDLFLAKPIATGDLLDRLVALARRVREPSAIAATAGPEPMPTTAPASEAVSGLDVIEAAGDDDGHFIGTTADLDPEIPEQLARIQYDPRRYLQGLILEVRDEALARGQAALIRGPWPAITLMPRHDVAQIAGNDEDLRAYGTRPDLTERAKISYLPLPLQRPKQPSVVPLQGLVWRLSLWASRGRLPTNTPLDAPVQLCEQPDFSHLAITPGAPQIAAFWSAEPHSLIDTVRALKLPQRQVFAFYSAAKAVGLVCPVFDTAQRVAVDVGAPQVPARRQQNSFARRFLARLRGG